MMARTALPIKSWPYCIINKETTTKKKEKKENVSTKVDIVLLLVGMCDSWTWLRTAPIDVHLRDISTPTVDRRRAKSTKCHADCSRWRSSCSTLSIGSSTRSRSMDSPMYSYRPNSAWQLTIAHWRTKALNGPDSTERP